MKAWRDHAPVRHTSKRLAAGGSTLLEGALYKVPRNEEAERMAFPLFKKIGSSLNLHDYGLYSEMIIRPSRCCNFGLWSLLRGRSLRQAMFEGHCVGPRIWEECEYLALTFPFPVKLKVRTNTNI